MKNYWLDPLNEEKYLKVKGLIHKYSSGVLILLSCRCPKYCAFCSRKRLQNNLPKTKISQADIKNMVDYIKAHPLINEVIFSGGEPLMETQLLIYSLKKFSKLPQIKILRIHSRAPVSDPKLVSPALLKTISKIKKPVYFSVHINHPKELSAKTTKTLGSLRKAGAILLSQTVFLKNFNDNYEVLKKLFIKLTEIGVRPYYLHHCDPVKGNEKWVVPFEKEVQIMTELRKKLSGLACPTLVIDSPTGTGKIPVPLAFWDFNKKSFKDFEGKTIKILA